MSDTTLQTAKDSALYFIFKLTTAVHEFSLENENGWTFLEWLKVEYSDKCTHIDMVISDILSAIEEHSEQAYMESLQTGDAVEDAEYAAQRMLRRVPSYTRGDEPDPFWGAWGS
jgi:hypothetical protein